MKNFSKTRKEQITKKQTNLQLYWHTSKFLKEMLYIEGHTYIMSVALNHFCN